MMKSYSKAFKILAVFFLVFFALITFVNHWCFRTYALDLGVYTAALYDYAHLGFHDSTSFKPFAENLLADHFDFYLILCSPLSWIFGVYTLLIVQVVAILVGGAGIYKLFKEYGEGTAVLAAVFFYTSFGIVASSSYDYHSNVIAVCMMPWLFSAIRNNQKSKIIFLFILILISKENLSLFLTVALPCSIAMYKPILPATRKLIWYCTIISVVYFFSVTAWIMPALSASGKMYQFRYHVLGDNYAEAVVNLVSHPLKYIQLLFVNPTGEKEFDYVKTELWVYVAASGGLLFLFNWPFLLMLLPVFMQKLFHNQPEMWGINDHYAADLSFVLTVGVFYTLATKSFFKSKPVPWQIGLLVLSIVLTVHMMDSPKSLVRRDNIRIYQSLHYISVVPLRDFAEMEKLVPADASISCQSLLHPHFAWRDEVYLFPVIKDAKYISLYDKCDYYPIGKEKYFHIMDSLRTDSKWETIFHKNGLLLLKRK